KRRLPGAFGFGLGFGRIGGGLFGLPLQALGLGFGGLGVGPGLFGRLAPLLFGLRFRAGLGFALLSGLPLGRQLGLGVLLPFGLYRHAAPLFGRPDRFARRRFHRLALALAAVGFFGRLQLLFGFCERLGRVAVRGGVPRDAHRVARFEQLQRRLGVDAEDGVL